MAQHPPSRAVRRGLAVAFSALTLSVVAATPSALASNGHANGKSSSSSSTGSSDHSKGNAGTSGDPSSPQPQSNADQNSGGANGKCPGGPYCSTRDGSPSGNGNGNGQAKGKPCAGCVGKADNKNPHGQYPNGSDHNAGYECDRNHGIGRTNPAHTGCTSGSGGGTDCTATPTAPECTNGGGGTDCTTNPDMEGCSNGGPECTTLPDLPECTNGGPECTATNPNGTCTSVLGEKNTRTPTGTPPTTNVLGENVTRTPTAALPFTGANIALMTGIAVMTMFVGGGLAIAARKRKTFNS